MFFEKLIRIIVFVFTRVSRQQWKETAKKKKKREREMEEGQGGAAVRTVGKMKPSCISVPFFKTKKTFFKPEPLIVF
jgi:hypothetical protein